MASPQKRTQVFVAVALVAFAAVLAVASAGTLPPITPTSSGFINVNSEYGAYLYYYFIQSQNNPATDPVILWLQGGPGCSSLFGAFVENGPHIVQDDGSFLPNPWSWNTNASVIYIDSPVGTGFSYVEKSSGYARNEQTIADELYTALSTFFFTLHPELSTNSFYIFGESYAGKYVPWLATTVLTNNQNATNKINLAAIGVGDGWVDPLVQSRTYSTFLKQNGLIDAAVADASVLVYDAYAALVDAHLFAEADVVGNSLLNLLVVAAGNVDVYDINYKNGDPTDPLQAQLQTILNREDVQKQLNASGQQWQACANAPYFSLEGDIDQSSAPLFPNILSQIPVLLYNGNVDLICNYLGTDDWASQIDWSGQSSFNGANIVNFTVGGNVYGNYKTYLPLTHAIIYGAGHMVPYNTPEAAWNLLYTFLNNGFTNTA